ncbi:uncharacterized protein LOC134798028 [Cydia splendana]|uniref:uncharacterized protein LOC134798028 n=1 Tax=Cydia splendana TaxID=1100963 RepID=UPI00300C6A15
MDSIHVFYYFQIICLASGLASSEKLDRSYLPPPGSKYSGGSPGDIDVPLEFPKQTPTGRPQLVNGKPEIELGVDRRPAPTGTPDSQKPGFTYFQNSYPVPRTTTSYAITQTTTFPAGYEGLEPNAFVNGSNIQPGVPGQNYRQPIRGPGQGPSYNQYRTGQSQSTVAPYGTTARPPFPNNFNGPEYLPPVSNKQSPGQAGSNQDGASYPSDLPQGPKYQDGISVNQPGFNQQNRFVGDQNVPSTIAPQYQNERFGPTGPGFPQAQKQFIGNQFPSSTGVPQYQTGQRFTTPGTNQQNQFSGNQDFPSSTAAPQYQGGQRLTTPVPNQQNQFSGNQDFPSSTAAPQYQGGQRLTTPVPNQQNQFAGNQDFPSSTTVPHFQSGQGIITPGLNHQVFGSRVPSQQNQYTGSQNQGNQFPSSTAAPTPASIQQNQYTRNENYPSTAAPIYQDGQRFTTPVQIQGGSVPRQRPFGSLVQGNQYPGNQNIPSSTVAPQFHDSQRFTTPGYIQVGYGSSVPSQENQYQYPGSQNIPSSTIAPQYQTNQQFTTGPGAQNFLSTDAPKNQNGRYSTPGQYQGQLVPQQQFGTPGQRQHVGNQNYPSSTVVPQYENGQRFLTPGSQQIFGSPQQNQYENQNFATSTTAPQYQDQRFSTPGLFNQPSYPGSTAAPEYHQTFAPTPGTIQQGVPSQQNQYQRPIYNQQFPSSTAAPQRFIPGSQPHFGSNIPTSGTEVAFPQQGLPGSENYGSNQQAVSQTEAGSIYGTAPSFSNQGFPSTTVGPYQAGDFASTPGFENIGGRRPERPQAEGDRNAEILSYENVLTPEGYFYSFDTSNGIHADETGEVGNSTRAQGGFTYTGDDGKVYSIVYTADENGFQPRGDHLPTPPPIPEAIQRVIDQANLDKEAGIDDDGSYNEEKYGYMKYEGPLTRFMAKNRTVSLVNGADIPERNEHGIDEQIRKVFRPKGSRPSSKAENTEPDLEKTDINESDIEGIDMDDDYSLNNNKEGIRRTSAKRPKPIKNLTEEDNRPNRLKGIKTQMKPNVNTNKDSSIRRPISSGEYEDNVSDDKLEEPKDNDDLLDSDEFDFDSDLVNYRDDPNNRTDFHGLNKYLPESKKTNRKNLSGKKRPIVRVDRIKKPVTGSGAKTTEDRYDEENLDSKPDFDDEPRTRIPSRKNKFGQKIKDQSKITGQTLPLESDDETNTYNDDKIDANEDYDYDDATKPVINNRKNKPATSQSKNKVSGKPKRPTANKQAGVSNNKENDASSYEETGYEYTPPQRKFGSEEATKFPSRTNQKGIQTTVRPFLTKHVYGDDEPTDEYVDQYGHVKPGKSRRPMAPQKYPDYKQGANIYGQDNPEENDEGRRPISFETSRRPFGGRPQTTVTPQYQDQGVTGQETQEGESHDPKLNQNQGFSTTRRPVSYGTSERPFGRPQSTLASQYPEQGVTGQEGETYNPELNQNQGFSTTRRPVSYGTSQRPFGRPQSTVAPQYQDQTGAGQVYNEPSNQGSQEPGDKLFYNTNAPNRGTVGNVFSTTTPLPPSGPDSTNQDPGQYQNRPTGPFYETTSPSGVTYMRPGTNKPGQVPSTTYRPNYSFGDKKSPVLIDGSGRQSTTAPAFDRTLKPAYTLKPNGDSNNEQDRIALPNA